MTIQRDRVRLIFHGSIVLLVGLFCGLPTVPEAEPMRLWHTAHESLILIGVLLLTMSSVLPLLVLGRSETRALVWSLLATGYGLMTGLVLQGITGVHAFSPTTSPVLMIAFIGNATGMFGSVVASVLTLLGASAAYATTAASVPAA